MDEPLLLMDWGSGASSSGVDYAAVAAAAARATSQGVLATDRYLMDEPLLTSPIFLRMSSGAESVVVPSMPPGLALATRPPLTTREGTVHTHTTTTASSLPAVVLPLCDSQTDAAEVFPDAGLQLGLDGEEAFQYRLNDEELYTVDQGLAGAGSLGFFTNAVVAVAAAAALVGLWIGNRLRLPLRLGFQPGPRAWARHFGKR